MVNNCKTGVFFFFLVKYSQGSIMKGKHLARQEQQNKNLDVSSGVYLGFILNIVQICAAIWEIIKFYKCE